MPTPALYDVLYGFKDIHKVVLNLAEDLNDEQLNWKPEGYSTSIGFHLWHLARESDYLKAAILNHYPQIGSELGDGIEIWQKELLAQKWGFPDALHETVGTGLSDDIAATLPIPKKDELLGYLRSSYETIERVANPARIHSPVREACGANRFWFGYRAEVNVIARRVSFSTTLAPCR
jgi:hypothetical protein